VRSPVRIGTGTSSSLVSARSAPAKRISTPPSLTQRFSCTCSSAEAGAVSVRITTDKGL
jgi:hypothetical protein